MDVAIYYEGGSRDRWWLAPAGLGFEDAMRERLSGFYRSAEGARRALVARGDAERRAESTR